MLQGLETDADDRRILVSISPFTPHIGVPHAGGEYIRRHLEILGKRMRVHLIVAGRDEVQGRENEGAWNSVPLHFPEAGPFARLRTWLVLAIKLIRGASLGVDIESAIRREPHVRRVLETADVVEFQYLETVSLARWIARINPGARRVLIVHDVLTQRWRRSLQASTSMRSRLYYGLRLAGAYSAERRAVGLVDEVIVFSQKDADLLGAIRSGIQVTVVPPPLADPEMPSAYADRSAPMAGSVLFTGAFARRENEEAAEWLLKDVWPIVQREFNSASLTLAGAAPSARLRALAEKAGGVEVTGYVDDLGPFYRRASVFVVPLFRGAGVKFKTITAMLWGVPIVATSVGREGIGSEDLYAAITDDAGQFAHAILDIIARPGATCEFSSQALSWAQIEFGVAGYVARILPIYGLSE